MSGHKYTTGDKHYRLVERTIGSGVFVYPGRDLYIYIYIHMYIYISNKRIDFECLQEGLLRF